jgi:hypothetical protein
MNIEGAVGILNNELSSMKLNIEYMLLKSLTLLKLEIWKFRNQKLIQLQHYIFDQVESNLKIITKE